MIWPAARRLGPRRLEARSRSPRTSGAAAPARRAAGCPSPPNQYPASTSQRPSWSTASQARPSSVASWNRARRRAADGSHQRSDSGQGPAQPVTRCGGSPRTASRAGAAETAQRPLTVTARPASSVTSASRAAGKTRPGAVPWTRPGQGRSAGRRGSVFPPNGTGVTWSCTFLPPPRTGRSTASCPSMACTRMAARATRSLTSVSPHKASCCPVARTTWSGTSRSATMPPGWYCSPSSGEACGAPSSGGAGAPPSSCQRTRSATAAADSSPSCRHRLLLSRPSAQVAVTCTRTQVSPRAARPSCSRPASALAANTTGSARGSGGSNSWTTDRSAGGGRVASGRESRPRASRCAPSPASPNLLATSRTGNAAKSPSVRRPSRFSRATRSWPAGFRAARTLTGWAARNLAAPPGGTARPSRAARSAAKNPSATPILPSSPRSASAAVILAVSAVSPPK